MAPPRSVPATAGPASAAKTPSKCMHGLQQCVPPQRQQAARPQARRSGALHGRRAATRPLAPRASADTAAPDELASTWNGFRCIKMDTTEFLIKELPEGQLDLREAFVLSADAEEQAAQRQQLGGAPRPAPGGGAESADLPPSPRWFHELPWAAEYLGNVLEGRDARSWVTRTYLVALESREPYRLDLSTVYCLDDKARSLGRCAVQWLAPEGTPEADLRLRLRDHVVTVDALGSVPGPEEVVRAGLRGERASSRLEAELAQRAGAGEHDDPGAATAAQLPGYVGGASSGSDEEEGGGPPEPDVLYDDDTLKDFLVEFDDEADDFDSPASDY